MLARCALLLSALAASGSSAFAQSATCRALQSQLAGLSAGGGGRAAVYANAAQRQIDEIQRISSYMRQLGCGSPGFFVFGQDVGSPTGGVFNATTKLVKEYPGTAISSALNEQLIAGKKIRKFRKPPIFERTRGAI